MADYDARGVQLNRRPCGICGRQFVPESLARHEVACKKSQLNAKKRKVFDSTKQRATEDLSVNKIKQAQKKAVTPPRSNWRAKHADFINTVRAARGVQIAMERGEPLPPPPPPSINPDYVQCPYCSRRFNEKAAERHINFCKEQAARKKVTADPNAKAKQNARIQYQAPKLKSKTPGSQTSGYSPVASSSSSSRGARSTPSSTNMSPAARQGVGRTPPGASNGYGRQQGSSTRGRPTGTTTNQYSSRDYIASPNGYQDAPSGFGKALRTGRDASAYHEARRNVKTSGNPHLKQTSSSSSIRTETKSAGGIRGTNLSPTGNGSYGYPSYREESDYYSSSSDTDYFSPGGYSTGNYPGYKMGGGAGMGGGGAGVGGGGAGRFCHECGTKYPVTSAKFCCECGVRRMMVS